jgi:surface protein
MKNCFYNCKSLTTAPVIPDGVNYMYETFKNCISLTTAPTIPSSVTNLAGTFHSCTSLITPPTILSSKANMQNTFNGCKSLTTAPVIPNGIADVRNCFENCTSLTQVPVIPSSVTSVDYAFRGCKALTTVDTTNWDTRNITSLNGLFYGCSNLIAINGIENWNTSKVTNVWDLFYGCGSLTDIDLSNWDMSKMNSTGCMYRYCSSLKTAYLPIQGGIPQNALHGCSSNLDVVWVGERSANFDIGVYSHSGFRKEDIQELVPEHLVDMYISEVNITGSGAITVDGVASTVTTDATLRPLLIGKRSSSSGDTGGYGRIYKVIVDGITFIPVLDNNGTPCMMRTDTNKFYYDTLGGTVTQGEVLEVCNGYSKLDYINCVDCFIFIDDMNLTTSSYITYYIRMHKEYSNNTRYQYVYGFALYYGLDVKKVRVQAYHTAGWYEDIVNSDGNKIYLKNSENITSPTLTLGTTYLGYLTEDEISQAVAKGWVVQ